MFPENVSLMSIPAIPSEFRDAWQAMMQDNCHNHPVWQTDFVLALRGEKGLSDKKRFSLAKEWSRNMVVGSFCFPRYVAALAARAPLDAVRHGLLENAWDESGSKGHKERSHFWLAVRLAELLGFSAQDVQSIQSIPEAQTYTDTHYKQCSVGQFGFALGMISLIEEFTTPEFTLIKDILLATCNAGLGMTATDFAVKGGTYYFDANIADDERHKEEMPQLVATWLLFQGVDLSNVKELASGLAVVAQGVRYSADLRLQFFEGIFRRVIGQ